MSRILIIASILGVSLSGAGACDFHEAAGGHMEDTVALTEQVDDDTVVTAQLLQTTASDEEAAGPSANED
jgi:hypothetical protein